MDTDRGFFETLLTGPNLLVLTALTLMGCGAFALFQAATGQFLPHDVDFLGLTAQQLCTLRGCRVVHFMIHDRISFGGVLLAIGVMYLWLAEFPLKRGESWAWWTLAISGAAGCAVIAFFLKYLQRNTLRFFIFYRLIFGIIVIALALFRRPAG